MWVGIVLLCFVRICRILCVRSVGSSHFILQIKGVRREYKSFYF